MDIKTKLETMIRARYPVIYINSAEEARVRRALSQVKDSMKKEVYCWSLTKGWHDLIGNRIDIKVLADKNAKAFDDSARKEDEVSKARQEDMLKGVSFDVASAIRAMQVIEQNRQARRIDSEQTSTLFVLFDAHPYLENNYVERSVRDAARDFPKIGRDTLLLVSPVMKLNDDLQKDITVIDIDLPEYFEMKEYLDKFIERQAAAKPEIFAELTEADKEKLYKATMGLTLAEAENAISKAIVQDKKLSKDSIKAILEEKKQIVRKSGSLEYYETDMGFENNIGGLDRLKGWMTERQGSFSEDAEAFGISKPKGALLLGVQGCGKSLVCQTLGSQWGLPVLRFDIGSIFQKFVGESEANMRKALKVAEAVAPCILWIDELEKGFAGMMESGDSGTSSRILSYFLTWLQINKHMIFVVATSNDVEKLPPELLRKGRLDEIFFIDLPTQEEREEIVRVHLRQRHRDPENFNVKEIAYRAYGFSGAEIEQAIESGLHKAFSDGRRELTDEDVIVNIKDTAPISQTMYKKVNSTRRWADDKARRASSFDFSQETEPDWWQNPEQRAAQDRAAHPLN